MAQLNTFTTNKHIYTMSQKGDAILLSITSSNSISVRCNSACTQENISWNSLSRNISKWRKCYTQSPLSCSLQRNSELSTTSCGDTSSDWVCCDFWTTCGPSHFTGDNRSSSQTYVNNNKKLFLADNAVSWKHDKTVSFCVFSCRSTRFCSPFHHVDTAGLWHKHCRQMPRTYDVERWLHNIQNEC